MNQKIFQARLCYLNLLFGRFSGFFHESPQENEFLPRERKVQNPIMAHPQFPDFPGDMFKIIPPKLDTVFFDKPERLKNSGICLWAKSFDFLFYDRFAISSLVEYDFPVNDIQRSLISDLYGKNNITYKLYQCQVILYA